MVRLGHLAAIALFSMAPLLALMPLHQILAGKSLDIPALVLAGWLLLLTLNAGITPQVRAYAELIAAGMIFSVVLFVVLPLTLDRGAAATVPVAELMGIKSERAVTLVMTEKACRIYSAAVPAEAKRPTCDDENANLVNAVVLSNVGSRWVVALSAFPPDGSLPSRVTLPAEGVQVVSSESPVRFAPSRCR